MGYRTACTVIGSGLVVGCIAVGLAVSRTADQRLPSPEPTVGGHQPASVPRGEARRLPAGSLASSAQRIRPGTLAIALTEEGNQIERTSLSARSSEALMLRALQAAKDGNLGVLRDLIPRLENVNSAGPQGNTLLHAAAAYGQLAAVRLLVGEGASVRATNNRGEAPLHLARGEVATLLISYGANVMERDARGATPLHRSPHNVAILLIANGAEISVRDRAGSTPMLNAIRRGDMPLTKLLISLGADVNDADHRQGVTPLHLAVRRGDTALVTLLIEQGADINAEDKFGNTPLSWTRSPLTTVGGKDQKSEVVSLLAQYGAH